MIDYGSNSQAVAREREYFLSLDLGMMSDYTAAVALTKIVEGSGDWSIDPRTKARREKSRTRFEVNRVKRFPLRTSYIDIAAHTQEMFAKLQERGKAWLVLDGTGVGVAIVDLFRKMNLRPVALTLTGGDQVNWSANAVSVPKKMVIQNLDAQAHSGALIIGESGQEEEEILREELRDFRVGWTGAGSMTFSHRSGRHDDILLALAIGLWFAAHKPAPHRAVKITGW